MTVYPVTVATSDLAEQWVVFIGVRCELLLYRESFIKVLKNGRSNPSGLNRHQILNGTNSPWTPEQLS